MLAQYGVPWEIANTHMTAAVPHRADLSSDELIWESVC